MVSTCRNNFVKNGLYQTDNRLPQAGIVFHLKNWFLLDAVTDFTRKKSVSE